MREVWAVKSTSLKKNVSLRDWQNCVTNGVPTVKHYNGCRPMYEWAKQGSSNGYFAYIFDSLFFRTEVISFNNKTV